MKALGSEGSRFKEPKFNGRLKDYPITLTAEAKQRLTDILASDVPGNKAMGRPVLHIVQVRAKVLLMLAEGASRVERSNKSNVLITKSRIPEIAQACGCSAATILTIRRTFAQAEASGGGLDAVLTIHDSTAALTALLDSTGLARMPPARTPRRSKSALEPYVHMEEYPIILTVEEKQRLKDFLARPVVPGIRSRTVAEKAAGAVTRDAHIRARVLLLLAESKSEKTGR
jgi:hypothetical protein